MASRGLTGDRLLKVARQSLHPRRTLAATEKE
jgi:hypothetical protein